MAVVKNKQYRPVSIYETRINDALSIKAIRDTADNINNYKNYVGIHPLVTDMFVPAILGPSSSTTETVIMPPTPMIYLPDGYDTLQCYLRLKRTAGSGTTYFKVICSTNVYKGPEAYDSEFHTDVFTGTVGIDSGTATIKHVTLFADKRSVNGDVSITITATNSDGSTQAEISSLAITPVIVYG
jgi:hypothetical protein